MKILYSTLLLFVILTPTFGQYAKMQFDNFTLEIEPMELWDQSKLLDKVFLADAEVDIELGETLEATTIHVLNSKLTNLNIEMRYETSVTIMNEGPHCDLINWKHYISEWTELKKIGNNTFKALSYSPQDLEKFPEISMDGLIMAVEDECPGWKELAQTIKSVNDYPSGVGVSRYFLKISGTTKSGNRITRILTFNVPMGC